MVVGFGAPTAFAGRGRLATGGEELWGYEIGEEADGILRLGGEEGIVVSVWGPDLDFTGVSAPQSAIDLQIYFRANVPSI